MKLPKLNQKGFGHVELLLIIVVIFAIVGVGYYTLKVRSGGIFNSQAEVSTAGSTASLADSNAEKTVAERDYTFELRKDNKAIANGGKVSGPVVVGVNMRVDRNITNVRFLVDGVEKGSKPGIGLTGFRDFTTWNTKFDTNGTHTVSVKAIASNGKEFDMYSSATNTKSQSVNVDNGSATRVPPTSVGPAPSPTPAPSTPSTTPVNSTKPSLSISPGPLIGVAGSKTGTVDGDKVTGGIVFTVKVKRPKAEVYDLASTYVTLTKDGQPRLTLGGRNDEATVKDDGDMKVYTFKRYYATFNKPNGSSIWLATFIPLTGPSSPDKTSEPLTVDVQNTDSTAEDTCKSLKTEVNDLFDKMTKQIDQKQQAIVTINDNINKRYEALNLATTNPIPDYAAKRANNSQLSTAVDTKQTELEALKITCAGTNGTEDVGAKVTAFKAKVEEAKAALSVFRASTLDLLGLLRSRLPEQPDDGGKTPSGFAKIESACFSFSVPKENEVIAYGQGNNKNCGRGGLYTNTPTSKVTRVSVYGFFNARSGETLQQITDQEVAGISGAPIPPQFGPQRNLKIGGQPATKIEYASNGQPEIIEYIVMVPRAYAPDVAGEEGFRVAIAIVFTSDTPWTSYQKTNIDKILKSWEWK